MTSTATSTLLDLRNYTLIPKGRTWRRWLMRAAVVAGLIVGYQQGERWGAFAGIADRMRQYFPEAVAASVALADLPALLAEVRASLPNGCTAVTRPRVQPAMERAPRPARERPPKVRAPAPAFPTAKPGRWDGEGHTLEGN